MLKVKKEDYARLLTLEINSYLKKIYTTIKRKKKLNAQKISASHIELKTASLGATKMWEFRTNSREKAAQGDVGKIIVVTRGLKQSDVRKHRALLIAAEYYVYHAFASNPDSKKYKSITCQNQYKDLLKKVIGKENSHDTRDQAIRYVIEEIKEHKLAHFTGRGWHTSIAKLKKHYPDIAEIVGSSENTFKNIFRKQHQKFTPDMLKQEEDLVRKEIEEIQHLITLLKAHEKKTYTKSMNKLIKIHLANLRTFEKVLKSIVNNLDRWVLVDRKEHKELKKKSRLSTEEMHKLLQKEAEAEEIDINKVHVVFEFFKKEKINILHDLEMLDNMSASSRK
ncbi:hypothetical protein HQ545_00945 [Candidatus Woesearchaeota archaeon]|nr:hypothetical protein [Candidatus Woesearchaeota archaeon]